jgi:hypothetical protein
LSAKATFLGTPAAGATITSQDLLQLVNLAGDQWIQSAFSLAGFAAAEDISFHKRDEVSAWFSKSGARTASTQDAAEGMTPQLLSTLLDVIESSFRISGGNVLLR